jgi:hypothetical protein
MNTSVKKMVAMPAELESDSRVDDNILINEPELTNISNKKSDAMPKRRENFNAKFIKVMKILLKLAKINGYDIIGQIRNKKGEFINGSDLISLILNAMSHGKLLLGESEFILLLKEANVEPELIVNENVRAKLMNVHTKIIPEDNNLNNSKTESQLPTTIDENRKIIKRKRMRDKSDLKSESAEEPPSKKRRWETIDSNEDEDDNDIESYEDDKELESYDDITQPKWEYNPHN